MIIKINKIFLLILIFTISYSCTKLEKDEDTAMRKKYNSIQIGDNYKVVSKKIGKPNRTFYSIDSTKFFCNYYNENSIDPFSPILYLDFKAKDSILLNKNLND